jgi:hypothetical protein
MAKYYIFNEYSSQLIASLHNGLLHYITDVLFSSARFKTSIVSTYNKAIQLLNQGDKLVAYFPAICVDPTFPLIPTTPESSKFQTYPIGAGLNTYLYDYIYQDENIRIAPGMIRIEFNDNIIIWVDSLYEYYDIQMRFLQIFNGLNRDVRLFTLTAYCPLPSKLVNFNQETYTINWQKFATLQMFDPQGVQIPTMPVTIQPYMKLTDVGDGSEKYGAESIPQFRMQLDVKMEADILSSFVVETNYHVTSIPFVSIPYPISFLNPNTEVQLPSVNIEPWQPNTYYNIGQLCFIPINWAPDMAVTAGDYVNINGQCYVALNNGITGSTMPQWNPIGITQDGTVEWQAVPCNLIGHFQQVTWQPNENVVAGDYVNINRQCYLALNDGVTGSTMPQWNNNGITLDGTIEWIPVSCSLFDIASFSLLQLVGIFAALEACTSGQTISNMLTENNTILDSCIIWQFLGLSISNITFSNQNQIFYSAQFCGRKSLTDAIWIIVTKNNPVNILRYQQHCQSMLVFADGKVVPPSQYLIHDGIFTLLSPDKAYLIFVQ